MKWMFCTFFRTAASSVVLLVSAQAQSANTGASADFLKRTLEYDYDPPRPGSYTLPALGEASDGAVLGTDGKPVNLRELMEGRIVVLSFIYTRCTDPRACLLATGILGQLRRYTETNPEMAEKLLLVSLSFDPAHDTPEVMARYARVAPRDAGGAEWLFLTTRSVEDLKPLLEAYGQRVDAKKRPDANGPFYHPLRVYLIGPDSKIRNIYSYGLFDPRLVVADIETLLAAGTARGSDGFLLDCAAVWIQGRE